ncbi:MAG: hypothetical protein P8Y15_15100 [Gemmatimonadales bacterium]|jgi:hypothetical protein
MIEALATVGKLIFLWFAVGVLGLAVACVVAFVLCSFGGFGWETCRFLRGRLSRRRIVLLPLLGALAVPGIAAAQEEPGEPPALQISFYMCDFNQVDEAMEEIETQAIPVWNELIDEGLLQRVGAFVHSWASEWNVGIYMIGESIESILDAVEEGDRRFEERYDDALSTFAQACPHHRDGFYTMGPTAEGSNGGEQD